MADGKIVVFVVVNVVEFSVLPSSRTIVPEVGGVTPPVLVRVKVPAKLRAPEASIFPYVDKVGKSRVSVVPVDWEYVVTAIEFWLVKLPEERARELEDIVAPVLLDTVPPEIVMGIVVPPNIPPLLLLNAPPEIVIEVGGATVPLLLIVPPLIAIKLGLITASLANVPEEPLIVSVASAPRNEAALGKVNVPPVNVRVPFWL